MSVAPDRLDELLALTLAQWPGAQVRVGQQQMIHAIGEAILGRHHLIVEAPTGVGKSLSYTLPALATGQKCVISTATKALQEQLVSEDLPRLVKLLAPALGRTPRIALLKGRSNYICRVRLNESLDEAAAALIVDGSERRSLDQFSEWVKETKTGDRSDLSFPATDREWRKASIGPQECPGASRCKLADTCFAEKARREAMDADIVVTNHHMLALDIASGGNILPEHKLLIIDEAHELVSIVTDSLGERVSAASLGATLRVAGVIEAPAPKHELERAIKTLQAEIETAELGRMHQISPELGEALELLGEAAGSARAALKNEDRADADRVQIALTQLGALRDLCERLSAPGERDVLWIEREGERSVLRIAPMSVASVLRENLFQRVVVATSATLTINNRFDHLTTNLGLTGPLVDSIRAREAREAVEDTGTGFGSKVVSPSVVGPERFRTLSVESPFDHAKQGILYVARDLPDPSGGRARADIHAAAVIDRLQELIEASGGRALCLFTSKAAATNAALALRSRLEVPVLVQGEDGLATLVRRFSSEPRTCLFGTTSLWQGIDVQGSACTLVTLDKLPFPRPDEPLTAARKDAADREGGNGFAEVYLTHAATLLAQGVGRLIRSSEDRGVVALLDPRLATKSYGANLLRSLPPLSRHDNLEVVLGALGRLDAAASLAESIKSGPPSALKA